MRKYLALGIILSAMGPAGSKVSAQAVSGYYLTTNQIIQGVTGAGPTATSSPTFSSQGIGVAPSANAALAVTAQTAASTGVVVNSQSSGSADVADFQQNGSTFAATRVLNDGGLVIKSLSKAQADAATPQFVGELVMINNYGSATPSGSSLGLFVLCVGTATTLDSWAVVNSSASMGGLNNGCGVAK